MGRILKAVILGWIGKAIYDFTFGSPEPQRGVAHARNTARRAPRRRAPVRKPA